MIQILEGTTPTVISTKAIGKMNKEDQDKLVTILNEKSNSREKLSWYFEMEKFVGWDPGANWHELEENLPDAEIFSKIAIVGARDWQEELKQVIAPISSEARFFEAYQKQEAIEWVER